MNKLSDREIEVLQFIADGYRPKQASYKLGIAERTVRNHLSNIYKKLDTTNMTHAVAIALREGIIK